MEVFASFVSYIFLHTYRHMSYRKASTSSLGLINKVWLFAHSLHNHVVNESHDLLNKSCDLTDQVMWPHCPSHVTSLTKSRDLTHRCTVSARTWATSASVAIPFPASGGESWRLFTTSRSLKGEFSHLSIIPRHTRQALVSIACHLQSNLCRLGRVGI